MTNDDLARRSRFMATLTNVLIFGMLVLNTAFWLLPEFARQYDLGFNLTAIGLNADLNVDVGNMPWWQIAGGLFLSTIPLLILANGLISLRRLFQLYSEGQYFAERSATQPPVAFNGKTRVKLYVEVDKSLIGRDIDVD